MMKVSALVCVTNPEDRQDPWRESLASMLPWADEIVVVDGGTDQSWYVELYHKWEGKDYEKLKVVNMPWPNNFDWSELPKHLNYGLERCTGDWVVRMDIDYVAKEDWKSKLKAELHTYKDKKLVSLQKFSTILFDKVYQKGPTVMCINRGYLNIKFGKDIAKYTDLCVPVDVVGEEDGVPIGNGIEDVGRGHLEFFNYDYCFKTKEFTAKEFLRFSLAHKQYFGSTSWGNNEEEALESFLNMMRGRLHSRDKYIFWVPVEKHPKFVRDKIKNMTKEMFGKGGWGLL